MIHHLDDLLRPYFHRNGPTRRHGGQVSAITAMTELQASGPAISGTREQSEAFGSVLIIDDDEIVRIVAEFYFRNRGARRVDCATNGAEALRIIDGQKASFDFILCDLNMPEMDGVELLRLLKQRDQSSPIAILSAEHETVISLAENIAKKHELNIVGALCKPLNFNDLDELILKAGVKTENYETGDLAAFTESELRSAIANDEILVYYQPKIDVATGKIAGAEALARWNHPDLGIVGPNNFIAFTESSELIEDLTNLVIRTAIEDATRWHRLRLNFKVAVNMSVKVLNNLKLPDEIAAKVDASGLSRSDFILEVTESRLLEQTTVTMEVLARLRLMGFDLSIDDFGTGYSNIEHLREYPFNELKIDRSFVRKATTDVRAQASVEASVALGKKLGLRLVAEGVEKKEDWDYIARLGVDEVQGFLIARPMPMNLLLEWYFEYRAKSANGHLCFLD